MVVLFSLFFLSASSQEKDVDKIKSSTEVLTDFSKMKENIPEILFKEAEGIIIVPKLINAGLGIGGKRGKGIATVKNADGTWSDPVFITMTGGSVGFQAGVEAVQLILVFRKRATLENIGKGTFTLGGDASIAAGPVGRNSSANTDYKLEAEVYSYSKAKGLFAGISLGGSSLHVDTKANNGFYGNKNDAKTLFAGSSNNSAEVTTLKKTLADLFQ